jgi:hypothetical protein
VANNKGNKINTNLKGPSLKFHEKKAKKSFAQQAALASLAVPFILVALYAILPDPGRGASGVFIVLGVQFLMLVTGIGLGVIALITRKPGTRDIVVKATIGLILNSVILCFSINIMVQSYQRSKPKVWDKPGVTDEQISMNAVLKYPGWLGTGKYKQAVFVAGSINDASEYSHFFNSNCEKEISIMSVSAINPAGHSFITLDISIADLMLRDNTKIQSLPLDEVLGSMKGVQYNLVKRILGPNKIAPGTKFVHGLIFLPRGFDWSKLDTVIVWVNGCEVEISGTVYTAKEKQQLYQIGSKNK